MHSVGAVFATLWFKDHCQVYNFMPNIRFSQQFEVILDEFEVDLVNFEIILCDPIVSAWAQFVSPYELMSTAHELAWPRQERSGARACVFMWMIIKVELDVCRCWCFLLRVQRTVGWCGRYPIFATLQIRDPGQVYNFVPNTPFSQQRNEKTLARSIILCQIPPPGRPCHPPRSKSGGTERGLRLPTMTS